jgi:Family of unknown function (DUF6114)
MATGNPVKHAAHRLALPGDWRPARPSFRGRADRPKPSGGNSGKQANWRLRFRAWRHTRPFWGGLLLVLAGLELLALPLSGILSRGAVRLVVYIGIGGVFGVLIGVLLITAGIAVWTSPAHRVFYGVAGVVMGIASFPASNLGGFFICMLLAIIGGSIAFAWAPGAVVLVKQGEPTATAEPATGDPAAATSPEAPTSPDLQAADESPAAPLAPGEQPEGSSPEGEAPAAKP